MEFFAHMRLMLKKGEGRQGLPCPEVRVPPPGPGTAAQHGASPSSLSFLLPPALAPTSWGTTCPPSRRPMALPVIKALTLGPTHRSPCAVARQHPQSLWIPAVA